MRASPRWINSADLLAGMREALLQLRDGVDRLAVDREHHVAGRHAARAGRTARLLHQQAAVRSLPRFSLRTQRPQRQPEPAPDRARPRRRPLARRHGIADRRLQRLSSPLPDYGQLDIIVPGQIDCRRCAAAGRQRSMVWPSGARQSPANGAGSLASTAGFDAADQRAMRRLQAEGGGERAPGHPGSRDRQGQTARDVAVRRSAAR